MAQASFSIWDVFPHRIYGRLYLAEDMSINAEDATYHVFQALSVASILVWTVGIPACAVVLLVRNRHALRTPTFQAQYVLRCGVVVAHECAWRTSDDAADACVCSHVSQVWVHVRRV